MTISSVTASTARTCVAAAAVAMAAAVAVVVSFSGCYQTDLKKLPVAADKGDEQEAELPTDVQVLARVDSALDLTLEKRHLNLKEHAAWQIVHGILAYNRAFPVVNDSGQLVSALDHVLDGGAMKGWTMEPGITIDAQTDRRGLKAIIEAGTSAGQGHADQWLGYMADCKLPPDQKVKSGGRTYTIEDWVLQLEHDVPQNVSQEYSWTIMALSVYRPTDYEWTASDGKKWSVAQLVEIEAKHDLATSPCGGAHRLVGLTMAVNQRVAEGGKMEGPWKLADDKIKDSIEKIRKFQNPDGSFSSNYLNRGGKASEVGLSLHSTGHMFEFLTFAMSDEELKEPWVQRAALYMSDLLKKTQELSLECGALYHATHGLVLYRERLFGPRTFPKS